MSLSQPSAVTLVDELGAALLVPGTVLKGAVFLENVQSNSRHITFPDNLAPTGTQMQWNPWAAHIKNLTKR